VIQSYYPEFQKMESGLCRRLPLAILIVVRFTIPAEAYGPLGHEIVGAIADERLANTATAAKVYALLDGLTLERAAVIADEIKGWDKKGVDDPRSFHYSAHRNIDRQLRDFWRANQPTHEMNSAAPSHHWFHTPTFQWCHRKSIETETPGAANGT
jgi:hypothetical protein